MSAVDSLAIVMGHSLNVIDLNPDHKDGPCVVVFTRSPSVCNPVFVVCGCGVNPIIWMWQM
jgi:hypothetical protein